MHYPAAPWHLQGYAIQTLHWLDIDRVRPTIPAALSIVPLFPGKTLGSVYIATYSPGSSLEYNELIVVSGLVYHGHQWGAWISHIYVDDPRSVQGGRELWGLPKEMAQFTWQHDNQLSVQVRQGDRHLCSLQGHPRLPGIRLPIAAPIMSQIQAQFCMFTGQGTLNWHLISSHLEVTNDSPFSSLGLGQGWLAWYSNPLSLTINSPMTDSG
ncbi:acetoacetate decarboxylase family protein [Pantanalinema sp. GBBB05]|uniref:acetoacetate decarboxylase family protein n=1 Tax=Pantanalinema sp. GBBB05 TaxID=2604139 RepID=UPI001E0E9009|nr:acetoacetate decarboxylase [Pantanalinema sp. GBBB05]